jgi:sulfatase maturation enzyme AslB (radical SAM superfamily)
MEKSFNETSSPVFLVITAFVLAIIIHRIFKLQVRSSVPVSIEPTLKQPLSVNYHFSRKCNYQCGFCFHTAKTSHVLSLAQAKSGLLKLKEAGMKKINFAGGEPFLFPVFLGELVKYSKESLKLERYWPVNST